MSWAEAAYIVSQLGGGKKPSGGGNKILVKAGVEAAAGTVPNQYVSFKSGVTEVDCTEVEGYGNLTVDNFLFIPVKMKASCWDGYSEPGTISGGVRTPRIEYDPATGKLTLYDYSYGHKKYYGDYWNQSLTCTITYDIYCVK